jgi:hypothetical protein
MTDHCITFLDKDDDVELFHTHVDAPAGLTDLAISMAIAEAVQRNVDMSQVDKVAVMVLVPVPPGTLAAAEVARAAMHQNGAPAALPPPATPCH